jgi:hypothetical protein
MIKRAAIILSARGLVIRARVTTQGFRRQHEEELDVEGFDGQRRDVEGRHEKRRNEEVRAFPGRLALKWAHSL